MHLLFLSEKIFTAYIKLFSSYTALYDDNEHCKCRSLVDFRFLSFILFLCTFYLFSTSMRSLCSCVYVFLASCARIVAVYRLCRSHEGDFFFGFFAVWVCVHSIVIERMEKCRSLFRRRAFDVCRMSIACPAQCAVFALSFECKEAVSARDFWISVSMEFRRSVVVTHCVWYNCTAVYECFRCSGIFCLH